ncbi:hypothetical protein [Actinomarinicola tropica]|uniref:Uncharacterized protein n=1 Tax=Actinomarinicola tropica TaxID=2789776 RepID=A0A5Q2RCA2_9ACTN|nr:hypothetical protein [Actinomarinicola tropica]QGG94519.1 hypothetical protein GH723_05040 [Actinomarinicola tropica]
MVRRVTIALLALVALVAASCGDDPADESGVGTGAGSEDTADPADDGDGSTDGPGEPVLLVDLVGAFTTVETSFQGVPMIAVYEDGTVIQPGAQILIYPGPALPAVMRSQVDAATVDAIVEAARAAGLDQPDLDYGQPPIADAGDTVVTVTIDGETYEHRATALGVDALPEPGLEGDAVDPPLDAAGDLTPEQQENRAALRDLISEVNGLVGEGTVEEAEPFDADRYRLLVRPASEMGVEPDMDPAPPVEWTVEGVELSRADCLPVEGDAVQDLVALLTDADALTRFTSGGEEWAVVARPVLPHEATCPDA